MCNLLENCNQFLIIEKIEIESLIILERKRKI